MSANVLYHFTGERVTPYLAGGLGFVNVNSDLENIGLAGDDTSTNFVWNWGGGIKSVERAIRVAGRSSGDDLSPSHWRLYGGVVFEISGGKRKDRRRGPSAGERAAPRGPGARRPQHATGCHWMDQSQPKFG